MPNNYRIAVIPGDGIGREVIPEGIRVLENIANKRGIVIEWIEFDWSCERFHKLGQFMPEDGLEQLHSLDAIFFGAVGFPLHGTRRISSLYQRKAHFLHNEGK